MRRFRADPWYAESNRPSVVSKMDECDGEGEQCEEDAEDGDDKLDLIDRQLWVGGWFMLSAVGLARLDLREGVDSARSLSLMSLRFGVDGHARARCGKLVPWPWLSRGAS